MGPCRLRFTPPAGSYPLSNEQASVFRSLCNVIVATFPGVLRRPPDLAALRLTRQWEQRDFEAQWAEGGREVDLLIGGIPRYRRAVRIQRDLTRFPPIKIDEAWCLPAFTCGPALTRLVHPWTSTRPWDASARRIRRSIGARARIHGTTYRDVRTEAWAEDDSEIAMALASVPWGDMLTALSLAARDTELWHRFRLHQLICWNAAKCNMDCPHADCPPGSQATSSHIFWKCGKAQTLWASVKQIWGFPPHLATPLQMYAIGWQTPPSVLDWVTLSRTGGGLPNDMHAEIAEWTHYWLGVAWKHLATAVLHRLWHARTHSALALEQDFFLDDLAAVKRDWARRVLQLREWVPTSPHTRVDRAILLCLGKPRTGGAHRPGHLTVQDDELRRFQFTSTRYVLLFDGGSRGNPGLDGSGSIVLRVTDKVELLWAGSMSFANHATTNNVAEFQGLNVGLTAAAREGWQPLHIIGDSKMILTLMRTRKPPKAAKLVPLYKVARQAADRLLVASWDHHYRSENKMADQAANLAMDGLSNFQAFASTGRPEFTLLRERLVNDTEPWLTRQFADHSVRPRFAEAADTEDAD